MTPVNTIVLTRPVAFRHLGGVQPKSSQLQIRVSGAQKAAIQRLARQAGLDMSAYVLSRVLDSPAVRFRELASACREENHARHGLAELNSFLSALSTPELRDAIAAAPAAEMGPFASNYVAAMVESACDKHGIPVPDWARAVPPLREPVFGSSLQSLRLYLLRTSPPPFRRRNIFIDASLGDRV